MSVQKEQIASFDALPISPDILKALVEKGFQKPSPIQAEAIPFLAAGRDVVGQAQTGSGKTAAFGIPLIDFVNPSKKEVQAVVLCPTRELAMQVGEGIQSYARYRKGLQVSLVYGGVGMGDQIRQIRGGAQVVVGTPGRVWDLYERGVLKFDAVKYSVLDEADEMLDMGFLEDIEKIFNTFPKEGRQTTFFSATIPSEMMDLMKRFMKNPEIVRVIKNELTAPNIDQRAYEVAIKHKSELLGRLLDFYGFSSAIIFANTKSAVDKIAHDLRERGYMTGALHGDMEQWERNNVMAKFRVGQVPVLVATDVAARGIDVDHIQAVFNYDLPLDEEQYVHRIGRTARAGRSGMSFSFVSTQREAFRLRRIEKYAKSAIKLDVVPTVAEVAKIRKERFVKNVDEIIKTKNLAHYQEWTSDLLATGHTEAAIIAALLHLHNDTGDTPMEDLSGHRAHEHDERGRRMGGAGKFQDRAQGRGGRFQDRRGDRGARGGSRGGEFDAPIGKTSDMKITIGRSQGVGPGDIVGAIAGECAIPGRMVGRIRIGDHETVVQVPADIAQRISKTMNGKKIKRVPIQTQIVS